MVVYDLFVHVIRGCSTDFAIWKVVPMKSQGIWSPWFHRSVSVRPIVNIFCPFYGILSDNYIIKWMDVLPQDPVNSRSREIRVNTFLIALKFDVHLGSSAAEIPVKSKIDTIIMTTILAASRLREIWRPDRLVNRGPMSFITNKFMLNRGSKHRFLHTNCICIQPMRLFSDMPLLHRNKLNYGQSRFT